MRPFTLGVLFTLSIHIHDPSSLGTAAERATSGGSLKLSSPAFPEGAMIPSKYTCDGSDVNPPLQIGGVPAGAKSLALIVDDPDAPRGTWTHWVVWNIEPKIAQIKENDLPSGAVQGSSDFGRTRYGGPCPPSGTHRYFFRIYAVDTTFQLPKGAKRDLLEKEIQGHILDQATLMGKYARKK
jgi:Raf kinase inhibitor-like YbhB/YbcL family protein